MCQESQIKTPIVVEGWTWGLDDVHSKEAAFLAKELDTVCRMADELLAKPITDGGELIGMLVRNLVLPFEKANELAKYGKKHWQPPYYLCKRTDAPPDELDKWAALGNCCWIRSIVENPNTRLETIEKLARHSDPDVTYEALFSGRLAQETIDRFASDVEPEIRGAVATLTHSPETLRMLAKSDDKNVLSSICHNKHTPTAVINEIGRRHLDLAASHANRVTDPAVLRSLCDKYGEKYAVYLNNKEMPRDADWRKHWPLVVNGHCWGLNEIETLAAAREVKDKKLIARMADDFLSGRLDINNYPLSGTDILESLIENEALPIEIAKQLPRLDTDWICRHRVVSRSDVTPEILDEFADQPGQYVVNNIVHNKKVKPETVARIALNGEPHEAIEALQSLRLPEEVLEKFASSEVPDFREIVACRTKEPGTLGKLAFDDELNVREAAVKRDIIAQDVLEKVALTDANLDVAAIATEKITNPEILAQVFNRLSDGKNANLARAIAKNKNAHEGIRVAAALLCSP